MDDYNNPNEGKVYISPSLKPFGNTEGKVRIATKVINSAESFAFGTIKDEIVLRKKEGASTQIKAKFIEDERRIFVLTIQGYSIATDKPYNASFSFVGREINTLVDFINNILQLEFETNGPITISDEDLRNLVITSSQAKSLIKENQSIFVELLKSEITKEDIIAVGYRKKQIEVFYKLLSDNEYFNSIKERKGCTNESLWQQFFEKNKWIFGYGLGYIFLSSLDGKKLEQVVQGYTIKDYGKRVDALMKTNGLISNLCFIEIKTQMTSLLEEKPYRIGCWAPSRELSGAVAQIQGTVSSALETLSNQITIQNIEGNPTGENVYNYQPKSFLIIGNLKEFISENGINKDKYRSFELYRKNINNPEIITFDELYDRAKFIVKNNES